MFEIFSRLARAGRRLKVVERNILYQKGLLDSKKRDKINKIKIYNEYIRYDLRHALRLIAKESKMHRSNYHKCAELAAMVEAILKSVEDISRDLEGIEPEFRLQQQSFVDAWFADLADEYKKMFAKIYLIHEGVSKLQEKTIALVKASQPAENEVAGGLRPNSILTKQRDLIALAGKYGFVVKDARRGGHMMIVDKMTGAHVTALPDHRDISPFTAQKVMKAMASFRKQG